MHFDREGACLKKGAARDRHAAQIGAGWVDLDLPQAPLEAQPADGDAPGLVDIEQIMVAPALQIGSRLALQHHRPGHHQYLGDPVGPPGKAGLLGSGRLGGGKERPLDGGRVVGIVIADGTEVPDVERGGQPPAKRQRRQQKETEKDGSGHRGKNSTVSGLFRFIIPAAASPRNDPGCSCVDRPAG